jgi:hypothetical protein
MIYQSTLNIEEAAAATASSPEKLHYLTVFCNGTLEFLGGQGIYMISALAQNLG